MSLHILDTDTLTLFRKGHPEVGAHVAATPAAQLAVTIITVDEQLTGWYTQLRKATNPAKLAWAYQGLFEAVEAFKTFAVLPLLLPAAHRYFDLRKQHPKLG